jgi:hypothetical protein
MHLMPPARQTYWQKHGWKKISASTRSSSHILDDLKEKFYRLISAIGGMSSGYRDGSEYIDEQHYQNTLDRLTDELEEVCSGMGSVRASRKDHLKLKLAALLYLLPDDADTEVRLATSLLADFEDPESDPQR